MLPTILVLLAVILLIFNHLVTDIVDSLSERFVSQKVFYDKGRTLQPLLQEITLAKKLSLSTSIVDWALDENNVLKKEQGLAELESFRQIFQDGSYFFVIDKSGNYYFNDADNNYDKAQLRYQLSPELEKDSWYYATKKSQKHCQLNVNNDIELLVTKVWINCLVRHEGKVIGIIGTGINLTKFIQLVLENDNDGVINIFVDKSGAIQAHPDKTHIDYHSITKSEDNKKTVYKWLDSDSDRLKLTEAINKTQSEPNKTTSLYTSIAGNRTLIGIAYLKEIEWFNLTLIRPNIWTLGQTFLPIIILIVGGIIIALLLATWLNHKLVLSRLYRLNRAIENVKSNEYNVDLNDVSEDEIGQLTHNFVEMTELLNKHQSNLVKAKNLAEQSNQLKTQFISNISHETRTPLSIIIGMTDLALKKDLSDKQQRYIEKANDAGKNLSKLIEKMLEFSELENSSIKSEQAPINLFNFVKSLQTHYEPLADKKSIKFKITLSDNTPQRLLGDEKHILLVLDELIENAFKFTDNDGNVSVFIDSDRLINDDVNLHFQIKDSGIGISDEQQGNLFKLFRQIDGSNTRQFGGVGIGLIYAKSLIEMMHGEIEVDSQLGKGSVFHFTLKCHKVG